MLLALLSLIVSSIPSVLLYIYLRNLRKDEPEYRKHCRRLLLRGVLCSVGVAVLAFLLNVAWKLAGPTNDLLKAAFRTFIIAAFIEEFVKYMSANKTIKKYHDKINWLDCIAFVAIVGIGFQWIETVVYLLESNFIQILVRGFTMGHPSYGMLMGYFIGKASYTGKRSYKNTAFLLPLLLHGMYDFSLAEEFQALNDNLVFVPFIMVIIEIVILIRLLVVIKKSGTAQSTHSLFMLLCRSMMLLYRPTLRLYRPTMRRCPSPDAAFSCSLSRKRFFSP